MKPDALQYVRDYYRVPAHKGGRVSYKGKPGTITGAINQYVGVRLDGEKFARPYHPTDLEYASDEKSKDADREMVGDEPDRFGLDDIGNK